VVKFAALERAWKEANEKYEREHVMPYLYDQPGRFNILVLENEPDLGHMRWTVDTPEDLAVLRAIYASFNNRDDFSMAELIEQSMAHPEWQAMNAGIYHNSFLDIDPREKDK
jgi:spore coat polysaccharide biosynthesis protein SpsF